VFEDAVAGSDDAVQDVDELSDVGHVQADGGFEERVLHKSPMRVQCGLSPPRLKRFLEPCGSPLCDCLIHQLAHSCSDILELEAVHKGERPEFKE